MEKRYPFKFLDAYTREDRDIFFGREEEVATLYEMVFQTDLLLVYGASGTGKTSLIQCGLASRFESHDWLALNIRRGSNLNEALDLALQAAGGEDTPDDDLSWLDEDLSSPSTTATDTSSLSPLSRRLRAVYLRHFKPIYLIFDQFEELYILGEKPEQDRFIETVQEILSVEQPVKIILSIREEYLGYLYEFERRVPELLRKKLRVEPMHLEKIKTVMSGIGELAQSNVHLAKGEETAIAEGIFKKIKGEKKTLSIELPYLQVFLDKWYLLITGDEDRQAEAKFSLAKLEDIGDIDDVLRDFLDEQVLRIAKEQAQQAATIWDILSPFVTLEGTKEPLSATELYDRRPNLGRKLIDDTLQLLENRRILRFLEQQQRYEVKHDSLAKQVHAKRSDEEIALLEVQRLIKSQVALPPETRAYFNEQQLAFLTPFLEKFAPTPEEQQWIDASYAELESQQAEEARRKAAELAAAKEQAEKERQLREQAQAGEEKAQRRLRLVRTLLVAAIIAVAFAIFGMISANKAEQEAEDQRIEALASKALAVQQLVKALREKEQRLQGELRSLRRALQTYIRAKQAGLQKDTGTQISSLEKELLKVQAEIKAQEEE